MANTDLINEGLLGAYHDELMKTHLAGGVVFDISAYNLTNGQPTPYADLATALGTGGANVPEALRKGGMSVKFIQGTAQSSDNKYVQYRLMADDWSTNTEDWSFCGNDTYVENPEFVRVVLDNEDKILEAIKTDGTKLLPAGVEINEKIDFKGNKITIIENPEFVEVKLDNAGHILWGIQKDGNVYFGAGVPQQVKDYVQQKIDAIMGVGDITEKIDTINEMIAFFDEISHDTTLKALLAASAQAVAVEKTRAETAEQRLDEVKANKEEVNAALNTKVDKEEGKSLIDSEFAENVHYIESPEYIEAKLDSEDKIVEATREDGTKVLPAGVETPKVNLEGATIENKANPEYIEAKVDAGDRLLEGTRTDGTKVIGGNLEVGGDMKIGGAVNFTNGIPQEIVDYIATNTGSGVSNIEYEDETGDMYATFDEADGVTDVWMEENGDIYAEIEE